MGKRALDIVVAALALAALWPVIAVLAFLIWIQDRNWPFYRGWRVGCGNSNFRMLKLRSMILGADRLGGSSTSRSDERVTRLGRFVRHWKLDELPQFWNVLMGQMSLVGPRPNVRPGGVDRYTREEMRLLSVRPGLTDLASIVFADEAEILDGAADPDARYDRVIRPWKSRLGLIYVDRHTLPIDVAILFLTCISFVSRKTALRGIDLILRRWKADPGLRKVCSRSDPLAAGEPGWRAAP